MIYLIRHGQTEFNRDNRVQGRFDSPLTALGIAQAEAAGARLAEIATAEGGPWRVVCSPQGRARRSAGLIAGALGLASPEPDARLIEIDYGALDGLLRSEIDSRWPHFAGRRGVFLDVPDAEPIAGVRGRAASWLADAEAEKGHVVAVAHAGIGRVIRAVYAGLPDEALRTMETPQDAFHRLTGGAIERIDCPQLSPASGRR